MVSDGGCNSIGWVHMHINMCRLPPSRWVAPVIPVFVQHCYILGIYKQVDIINAVVVLYAMLKMIVGFILGGVAMFLVMGIGLIYQDEKQIKELKEKAKER